MKNEKKFNKNDVEKTERPARKAHIRFEAVNQIYEFDNATFSRKDNEYLIYKDNKLIMKVQPTSFVAEFLD